MTFGFKLPITTPATITNQNGNNPCYAENPNLPNGHVYSAMVAKSVSGTYNIFILRSHDWGDTWTEEQITFMTSTRHQYIGSCCPDLDGRGLHVFWYGYGYGTYNQTFVYSMLYAYRDAYGVWSGTQVVEYGRDLNYAPGYPRFRAICHLLSPSAAIDGNGDVHLSYIHYDTYNPYFLPGSAWDSIYYRKLDISSGVWGDLAHFHFHGNGATHCDFLSQNLQVDYYGNPHICAVILSPVNGWGYAYTTCWFMNPSGGDWTAWPGTQLAWDLHYYGGQLPVLTQYAELLYDTPASGTPSYYCRMALSHFYDEGTFDYPHGIYLTPGGVFHKYMDVTGWHTERVNSISGSTYPTLALGKDGMIYALTRALTQTNWEYRKKALPADAWSDPETILAVNYPRPVHHQFSIHYPLEGQDCSPFMAIHGGWAKLFRCGMPASGYGYFM